MKTISLILAAVLLSSCGKLGISGIASQVVGNWAEVKLPLGCVAKQVAGEEGSGVIVLCEDGRVFH